MAKESGLYEFRERCRRMHGPRDNEWLAAVALTFFAEGRTKLAHIIWGELHKQRSA